MTTTALEMRSTMANFTQKVKKVKKTVNCYPNNPTNPCFQHRRTHKWHNGNLCESTDPQWHCFTTTNTHNDCQLITHPIPYETQKSAPLHTVFELQAPLESPASTTIVTGFKTRSESAGFTENNQKVEKSAIFTQKVLETIVLGHSKCPDDIDSSPVSTTIVPAIEICSALASFMKKHQKVKKLTIFTLEPHVLTSLGLPPPSIAPTKHPCNQSGLHFINSQSHLCCHHSWFASGLMPVVTFCFQLHYILLYLDTYFLFSFMWITIWQVTRVSPH